MAGNRGNILIVDDRFENLQLLSEMLVTQGYKVRKLLDGARALDAAQLQPPDLILLDIMMPRMNGYEICQRLKANPRTQEIPVIFLSALDDVEDKLSAFAVGGVDYITKPFQQEEVLARVKTHLQIRILAQTLKQQNGLLAAEVEQRKSAEVALKQALDELKMAQEQIISREKLAALGTLTAGIAHELRNPLNFVNNYAEGSIGLADELLELLETQAQQIDQTIVETIMTLLTDLKENANAIHQHGQRAAQIINNMMQHARADDRSPQWCDLNQLLDTAIDLAVQGNQVAQPDVAVTIFKHYDGAIGSLKVWPNELSRAFINLIDNALYALQRQHHETGSEFQPRLSIQTYKRDDWVEVRIRDNGIGIAIEHQHRIFDPFFTTKPTGKGTGLGLSMTQEIIVNQHQGSVHLETESGRYAEFIVMLPITPMEDMDSPPVQSE